MNQLFYIFFFTKKSQQIVYSTERPSEYYFAGGILTVDLTQNKSLCIQQI